MKEIYFAETLYHQNWLNIFEFALYFLVFLTTFSYLSLWFFYLISTKRSKKFKQLSTQLLIFLIATVVSFIMGLVITFNSAYGDFDKIITDGNEYIATHSVKFWKEYHFKKTEVKEIDKQYIIWEYYIFRRKRGYILSLKLNNGQILHSDFVAYTDIYNIPQNNRKAQKRADKLLLATGLSNDYYPVSVYPRWQTISSFYKGLKKYFYIALAAFGVVALVMGGIIFFFKMIVKSSQNTIDNFSEIQTDHFSEFNSQKKFDDIEKMMENISNNHISIKNRYRFSAKKSLEINGIFYQISVTGTNDKISIECNGVHYNSPNEIKNKALRKEVQQIINKNV